MQDLRSRSYILDRIYDLGSRIQDLLCRSQILDSMIEDLQILGSQILGSIDLYSQGIDLRSILLWQIQDIDLGSQILRSIDWILQSIDHRSILYDIDPLYQQISKADLLIYGSRSRSLGQRWDPLDPIYHAQHKIGLLMDLRYHTEDYILWICLVVPGFPSSITEHAQ